MYIDLEGTFLFKDLTKEQQALIVGGSEFQTFYRGDLFIKDGDIANSLYIIIDGLAQVMKSGGEGVAPIKTSVGKGVVLGEMSFGDEGAKRTATCMASEGGVRVLCVPYSTIRELKDKTPDLYVVILERLLKIAHGYLRDTNEHLYKLRPAIQFAKRFGMFDV